VVYRRNGRLWGSLGATRTVKYVSEAQRQREAAKSRAAEAMKKAQGEGGHQGGVPFDLEEHVKEYSKIKDYSFAQLDAHWQNRDNWYRNTYCAAVPFDVREKVWRDRGGHTFFLKNYMNVMKTHTFQKRPGQPLRTKFLPSSLAVFRNWAETQRIVEDAHATVAAAAHAVQSVQAANPQVTHQEAVASASRVASGVIVSGPATGGYQWTSPELPAGELATPVVPTLPAPAPSPASAPAASPVAGVAGAGLAAAGLYLLFGL